MSSTSVKDEQAAALAVYGKWVGLKTPERAPLWVERLGINEDEIARFRNAPTPAGPAYRALAIVPDMPEGGADGRARDASSRISVQDALANAQSQMHLNAFTRFPESLEAPKPGYLHGTPIVVKDLIGVAGLPRSGGSYSEADAPYPIDAASVAAMKKQGAVVLGLANLHELAFGANSDNPVFGRVVNPITPERIAGGSSGGSAAAVAAGIVDIALATDTGGSIRIPAACCGVVGFKPSYDSISREGAIDIAESLDHIGPIGRTVEDCARAFAAMTGLQKYPGLSSGKLEGLRVGVLGGYFQNPVDIEVGAALTSIQIELKKNGAFLHECEIDRIDLAAAIQFMTISSEAAASQSERLRDKGNFLGEDVRVRLEMASLLPAHWYLKSQRLRRELVEEIERLFEDADVLLSPTMRSPAPLVGASTVVIADKAYPLHTAVSNLTLPYSLSGMPAIAIPWGRTKDGAPLSIQIAAPSGKDWKLLEIASRLLALAPSP